MAHASLTSQSPDRRTVLKLAAAMVVMPTLTLTAEGSGIPEPRDGETWASLAESMAQWERSANRDNFGIEWRSVRTRSWIPWNHMRATPPASQDVSLVYVSSPEQQAPREIMDALGLLADAGIQTLGLAATNCDHVAAAFVWANHRAVQASLGDWFIERPRAPCEEEGYEWPDDGEA